MDLDSVAEATVGSGGGVLFNVRIYCFSPSISSPSSSRYTTTRLCYIHSFKHITMAEITPRKEKKDKKRKSDAAGLAEIAPVAPEAGSASAEAVAIEVDGEKALKKAKKDKKEKRKSVAAEGVEGDAKVSSLRGSHTVQH